MTPVDQYLLTWVAQTTVVSLSALLLMAFCRRGAARRHDVGVIGLALVLVSPIGALLLPRALLWQWAFTSALEPAKTRAPHATNRQVSPPADSIRIVLPDESRLPPAPSISDSAPNVQEVAGLALPSRSERIERSRAGSLLDAMLHWRLGDFACAVWIAGSAVAGAIWVWQWRSLRKTARALDLDHGRPLTEILGATETARSLVRDVCDAVGMSELPPIAVSDALPMPLVLGFREPVIVAPSSLLQPGCEDRLRDVLIHEAAHVKRRDVWLNIVQRLARVVWWWHPAVIGMNRIVARTREEVCDNYVLRRADATHYAKTLLELAERCSRRGRLVPSLGLLGARWTLEKRIVEILRPGRNLMTRTNRRAALMISLVLGSASLLTGGLRAVEEPQATKKESNEPNRAQAAKAPDTNPKPQRKLHKVIVQGQCVDDNEKPLAGVRIVVVRRSEDYASQTIAGETKSDIDGRFELRDVETALLVHGDLLLAAALKGYVSSLNRLPLPSAGVVKQQANMGSNPATLAGVVSDADGKPIPGVTVHLSGIPIEALPAFQSAVTDEKGRYALTDLAPWSPDDVANAQFRVQVTSRFVLLEHPGYAKTMSPFTAIPQEVNVTLYPPAIIEGKVIDAVTNQPAANVTVSAQAVARAGWDRTRTDANGRYRLLLTRDHYNWAEADDRIAIAVKALRAESGETVKEADIRLVRGGFVVGTVFGENGKPISPTKEAPIYVAHYGPARPRTGAAVTSTPVAADGTYRLRVAPGENYVYAMTIGASGGSNVTVDDRKEAVFDIHLNAAASRSPREDADSRLARKLRQAAQEEDDFLAKNSGDLRALKLAQSKKASRKRPETPAGRLLYELEEQNSGSDRFNDPWAQTIKNIVDLGPDAVPDLIAELDATDNDMMLRCLGFMLRAIGDKRAVPALIRSIPKTLRPPGSDMGLRAEDDIIAAFMQIHDLDPSNQQMQYDFGRPVREIFGALTKLTGQSFDEEELFHIFLQATPRRNRISQELYAHTAKKWARWWEEHWPEHVKDQAYARVGVPELPRNDGSLQIRPGQRYKTVGGSSGWVLESYLNPNARIVFLDLDTGRAAGLPKKWREAQDLRSHQNEIEAWAAQEGYDLMGTEYASAEKAASVFVLRPLGLIAWQLGKERWKMSASDITFESLQAEGSPARDLLLHYDRATESLRPREPTTFLFKTREGTPGLLFVGIEVHDDSLKPGGVVRGDDELMPIAFTKGRRLGWSILEEIPARDKK